MISKKFPFVLEDIVRKYPKPISILGMGLKTLLKRVTLEKGKLLNWVQGKLP